MTKLLESKKHTTVEPPIKEEKSSSSPEENESVGRILQKARTTHNITVDDLAKKLKLNPRYIHAIEGDEYDKLPPGPYMRIYIRSMCICLNLSPEKLTALYYEQIQYFDGIGKGNVEESFEKEKEENTSKVGIYSLFGIITLGLFGFWAFQTGWISGFQGSAVTYEEVTESEPAVRTEGTETVAEEPLSDDDGMTTPAVAVGESIPQNNKAGDPFLAELATAENLVLTLSVQKDSVWIHLFRDGKSWRNFVFDYRPRTFYAKDSFNIKTSNNRNIRYSLSGVEQMVPGRGIQHFTLSRRGLEINNRTYWNSIMKKRFRK